MDEQMNSKTDWQVNLCTIRLIPSTQLSFTAEQLRGFFGYFFLDDEGFHHHGNTNAYRYPLVQYKVLDGIPVLLGIGDYADVVQKRASEIERATLPAGELEFARVEVSRRVAAIKNAWTDYRFLTPWIALNQENCQKFQKMTTKQRTIELERILIGNILSFLKAFNFRADFRVETRLTNVSMLPVHAHGHGFQGFLGSFSANLRLPPLVGLGKSVSKGFGTIKKVEA